MIEKLTNLLSEYIIFFTFLFRKKGKRAKKKKGLEGRVISIFKFL